MRLIGCFHTGGMLIVVATLAVAWLATGGCALSRGQRATTTSKSGGTASAEAQVLARVMEGEEREMVVRAMQRAGAKRGELVRFLAEAAPEQMTGAVFLVAFMPEHDLVSLKADFLQATLVHAYKAWKSAPWASAVPEKVFLQYILPYAQLDERRDNWRKDFFDRFAAKAWQCKTAQEAAVKLNEWMTQEFGVTYHATKRSKPNQSPYEAIAEKHASCTGLSILYADACRAVGLPARITGVPCWTKTPGNHNWVEIWDGQWWCQGSIGKDPRDGDWVTERCKTETDAARPAHSVYAVVFRPSVAHFPLPWDLTETYVPAENITAFYKNLTKVRVGFPDGGKGTVRVNWGMEIVAEKACNSEVELYLASGETYEIEFLQGEKIVGRQKLNVK